MDISPIIFSQLLTDFVDECEVEKTLDKLYLDDLLNAVNVMKREVNPGFSETISQKIANAVTLEVDENGTGTVTVKNSQTKSQVVFPFENNKSLGYRRLIISCSLPRFDFFQDHKLSRQVSILFVHLNSTQYPVITAPLGIITLGGHLHHVFGQYVRIEYLDMQLESYEALRHAIESLRPDVVGLSAMFGTHEEIFRAVEIIHSARIDDLPLIVMGNVVPTYAPDNILLRVPEALCILGRAETAVETLVRIIADGNTEIDFKRVPNAVFMQGATITETTGFTFDLTELDVPDWTGYFGSYDPANYQDIWIEASRGCPHKRGGVGCSFCAIMPNNDSRGWVSRPIQMVLKEIEILAHYGVKHIRFADEEFMAGQTIFALEMAEHLINRKLKLESQGLTFPTFDFAIRVDDVHKRGAREARPQWESRQGEKLCNNDVRRLALLKFKEAGLVQVFLGMESGSFRQLKRMYKATLREDNQNALAILRELGIQIACGWIMIDPLMEGFQDIKDNLSFIADNNLIPRSLRDDFVTGFINRMKVLEGSPMIHIMRRYGLLGHRKENLVEYHFKYRDPRISELASILDSWENSSYELMYALKMIIAKAALEHSESSNDVANCFFDLKGLDYALMCKLTILFSCTYPIPPEKAKISEILDEMKQIRENIVSRVKKAVAHDISEDPTGTIRYGLVKRKTLTIE